ncbi:BatD family protein [Vibrio aphrogenes]|uniref:BatD family protein n=1 Tax=Vibrio aphrogenes TaxID=1891186 RepID=UPI000B356BAA|nr:BatD family protein [Vibrio aphrogenes]
MKRSRWLVVISLLMMALTTSLAQAQSEKVSAIQTHKISDQVVEVKTWLGADADHVQKEFAVNQQIILIIDVSTPRWFVGSTTIGHIDVPNLVAKQRQTSATNYTSLRDGQTWAHQRWEITLYPQHSGQYTIPALPVTTHIAGNQAKKVKGTIWTSKLTFDARLPDGTLTDKEQWFSATDASIKQTWLTSNEKVKVGDAITRTVNIEAKNALSMLLPQALNSTSSSQYQAYADPAQLSDTSERGEYLSSRQDKVVYVLQQGGDIRFPALTIKWWNTKTQKVETVVLAGKTFHVTHTPSSFIKAYWPVMAYLLLIVIGLCVILLMIRRYLRHHEIPLFLQFQRAVRQKDYARSRLILYIKLKRETKSNTFNANEGVADIGETLVHDAATLNWRSIWRKIKPNHQHSSSILTPLELDKKLKELSKH